MHIYLELASVTCLYFLLLTLVNNFSFRKLNIPPIKFRSPKVSILIPARDEERNIRACLDSLLKQDYTNYEILVMDDNSSDATASILREYQSAHPRIKAFTGKPLPPEWLGKHFACHQLAEKADGDFFMFTDADTTHQPKSVSWALTNLLHHKADFLSAYPRQTIGSLGEAIVVPCMYLATSLFLPVWMMLRCKNPLVSFAIGQFVVVRREVFKVAGGYEAIKDCLVDDISMVRNIKKAGFKTLFLDGKDFVTCRMYHGYGEAFRGFVKSLYAALDKSLVRLLAAIMLISATIILPLIILAKAWISGSGPVYLATLPVIIFLTMWTVSLVERRMPAYYALLYPAQFINLLAIAVVSAAQTGYGKGALWKRRLVK